MQTHDTEYVWADMYTQAVHDFDGQRPTSILEHELVQHFERHPAEFAAAIAKTAQRFQQRKIHSPWPIVLRELQNADARHTVTASDQAEKNAETRRAEAYIRNAGLFLPTEDELIAELYEARSNGHRNSSQALLAPWHDDDQLRDRMLQLWRDHQPGAQATVEAARARAEAWKTHRHAIENAKHQHAAETTTTPLQAEPTPTREPDPEHAQPQHEHASTTRATTATTDGGPPDQPTEATTTPPVATDDDNIPL